MGSTFSFTCEEQGTLMLAIQHFFCIFLNVTFHSGILTLAKLSAFIKCSNSGMITSCGFVGSCSQCKVITACCLMALFGSLKQGFQNIICNNWRSLGKIVYVFK